MAIAVGSAGGLGALPCAMLNGEQVRAEIAAFRRLPGAPLNLNLNLFSATSHPRPTPSATRAGSRRSPLLQRSGADFAAPTPVSNRALSMRRVANWSNNCGRKW